MTLYSLNGGSPVSLTFNQMCDSTGKLWTDLANNADGLAACGFVAAPDKPAFDPATQVLGWTDNDWTVSALPGPTLEQAQAAALTSLQAVFDTKTQAPFAWDFGNTTTKNDDGSAGPAAGAQTLQMRVDPSTSTDDPKNWLGVYGGAIAALIGGAPTTVLPIKATSNLWIQTTAEQVVQALATGDGTQTGMLARQSEILARFGALKSAVAAAADVASVSAIDQMFGWPA